MIFICKTCTHTYTLSLHLYFLLQQTEDNNEQGIQYMIQAADAGDRGSMLYMAKAFETGDGLSSHR
jgi:TPR repeat protein